MEPSAGSDEVADAHPFHKRISALDPHPPFHVGHPVPFDQRANYLFPGHSSAEHVNGIPRKQRQVGCRPGLSPRRLEVRGKQFDPGIGLDLPADEQVAQVGPGFQCGSVWQQVRQPHARHPPVETRMPYMAGQPYRAVQLVEFHGDLYDVPAPYRFPADSVPSDFPHRTAMRFHTRHPDPGGARRRQTTPGQRDQVGHRGLASNFIDGRPLHLAVHRHSVSHRRHEDHVALPNPHVASGVSVQQEVIKVESRNHASVPLDLDPPEGSGLLDPAGGQERVDHSGKSAHQMAPRALRVTEDEDVDGSQSAQGHADTHSN